MRNKENYLLVASFLEGKNFAKRVKTQLVVEAKFDGEQLSSDPVDHSENIEINQELAWELDKKSLQQHKLQRSVIKVICYAINEQKKENIGYFVLDIRSAPDYIGKPKWYSLLQAKYPKLKPEIKVNLYIENSNPPTSSSSVNNNPLTNPTNNQNENKVKMASVDSPYKGGGIIDSKKLKATLIESEGYYLIGQESHKSQTFVLSITILYAKNLVKLLPDNFNYGLNNEFYFYYTLMNNRILTKKFTDILTSQINAERASIRIHTTIDILKVYLLNHQPIELYFCYGDNNLVAKTKINFNYLFNQNEISSSAFLEKPIFIDQEIKLDPIDPISIKQQQQQQQLNHIDNPSVGIQISLRKENLIIENNANSNMLDEKVSIFENDRFLDNNTPNVTPVKNLNNSIENVIHTPPFESAVQLTSRSEVNKKTNNEKQEQNNNNEELQLRIAYELQLWKDAKEKEFENYLKEIEAKKLHELAEAFKQRDKERELIVQKKVKEYNELEIKLKNTLNELEKREKQLNNNELNMNRMKTDLQRDYESKLSELRDASKRVQEQAEHHVSLHRLKCEALDDEVNRLKKTLNELEKKYADKEAEFGRYKEAESLKPEIRLQSEINLLTIEKNGLERKLESVQNSKNHYKEQWIKALQEIASIKKREEVTAKSLLKKQQIELDHLRLKYLAAEENMLTKTDEKQLESLKTELDKLKTNSDKSSNENIKSCFEDIDSNLEEHIARLIEERDTLLKTGVYSNKDTIIIELDKKIREAMSHIKK